MGGEVAFIDVEHALDPTYAAALGVDVSQISVKATTEEHLGFTGDGSGMAAHAVALLERLP